MPQIALIGRQNVGKSTLFNALIGRKKSIAYDQPGVTRDLVSHQFENIEGNFNLTDFPGLENPDKLKDDRLSRESIEHALSRLHHYHLLLWVVDRRGLDSYDYHLADLLRKQHKPVWLVVNYVDDPSLENEATDFYSLGIEKVFFVSALNRRNIALLRESMVKHFQAKPIENENNLEENNAVKLAIIGKPNAGKSTLFNLLLNDQRALISDIPGTTRDSIEEVFSYNGEPLKIIDTAGLRKKRKVHENVEFYSTTRTRRSIEEADVVILLIDSQEGIDRQVKNLISRLQEQMKPLVVGLNKVDLFEKDSYARKKLEEDIEDLQNTFFEFPIVFFSAQTGKRALKLIERAIKLHQKATQKIFTARLNQVLAELKDNRIIKSNRINLNYITHASPQLKFLVFTNRERIPNNVNRYLQSRLSKAFDIADLPVKIEFRSKYGNKRT